MNRKLLVLGGLLGMHQAAQAQQRAYVLVVPVKRQVIQYGLFGSFQSSYFTASNTSYYSFRSTGGHAGGGGGAYLDLFLSRRVAFEVGLNTYSRGGQYDATYVGVALGRSTPAETINSHNNLALRYYALPLGLKVYSGTPNSPVRLYGQLLFSTSFLLGATNRGQEQGSYTNAYGGTSTFRYDKQLEILDEDLSLGLGAQFRLTPRLDAFGVVRYCAGVISVQRNPPDYSNSFYPQSGGYPLYNRAVSLEAGLVFVPYRGQSRVAPPPANGPAPTRSASRRGLGAELARQ